MGLGNESNSFFLLAIENGESKEGCKQKVIWSKQGTGQEKEWGKTSNDKKRGENNEAVAIQSKEDLVKGSSCMDGEEKII